MFLEGGNGFSTLDSKMSLRKKHLIVKLHTIIVTKNNDIKFNKHIIKRTDIFFVIAFSAFSSSSLLDWWFATAENYFSVANVGK